MLTGPLVRNDTRTLQANLQALTGSPYQAVYQAFVNAYQQMKRSGEKIMNIHQLQAKKTQQQKITMLTCYDACFARLLDATNIDIVLIGDSTAMVMHGHDNTITANLDMMTMHTRMVAPHVNKSFVVTDMPFFSYSTSPQDTMQGVKRLMQAGAQSVKLEGCTPELCNTIKRIVDAGVPVMGHLGLTLQFMHQLGGFKVQGKDQEAAEKLLEQAQQLERAGCYAIVLECMPPQVAAEISKALTIPTLGIGAGAETDGQVLVLHDMLGLETRFKAKFVKNYLNGAELVTNAINQYIQEVTRTDFPSEEYCY